MADYCQFCGATFTPSEPGATYIIPIAKEGSSYTVTVHEKCANEFRLKPAPRLGGQSIRRRQLESARAQLRRLRQFAPTIESHYATAFDDARSHSQIDASAIAQARGVLTVLALNANYLLNLTDQIISELQDQGE